MEKHDKLGKRLGIILTRLNTGERLYVADLSREFGVSERTVQRDFNNRLNYLPIEREGANYWIKPSFLGRLSNTDIKRMLTNMGVRELYPDLNGLALNEFSHCDYPAIQFYPTFKASKEVEQHFKVLLNAIHAQSIVKLHFLQYEVMIAEPYQLIQHQGDWRLLVSINSALKTFQLKAIQHIEITEHRYTPNAEVLSAIQVSYVDQKDSTNQPLEAVILAQHPIAHHFKETSLLPEQHILKEHRDGDLVLSTQLQSPLQLAPHIAYWSPHLVILSPTSLQTTIDYHQALRHTDEPK
ncbi:helix-turn-helix transcriptional regulator [Vibrio mexicanus]|uniref:helix-turn-helix transcriptional regulator n=1 Tax=Vibrio mexicanus TaxID=1004326 RepID=UPI00063C6722|nr:WYL domain-containing protein [Vibrio mexicanus]